MRFAIYGSGGVGGYFGARLAEAGEEVGFIARGEHLDAIRRDGLRVRSPQGDCRITSAQASDDPAEIGPVDYVLVAVKAWQVAEVADGLGPLLGPETLLLPLENGVEASDHLAERWGRERVLGGLCGILAYREAPGVIRHAGVDPFLRFGELDNRRSERTQRLKAVFDAAPGVTAEIPDDIHTAIWSKFLFICAMSGVGAITRAPIGISRTQPETRRMLEGVWRRSAPWPGPAACACPMRR
ncbi:2-dehydropantoate 2-reductase [Halomonas pacifica]|uniref:ketopantoate reductase family protein n=1 Tax=Bisbaumannia pacifica TaxID=77098 RepID=UPI00235898FC|nr:2-dehydropantoate 2-reductase [Halomonas pacifica]MDC8804462.1 2-dehydropantoate 2-reductase [Halomonas pacifica]